MTADDLKQMADGLINHLRRWAIFGFGVDASKCMNDAADAITAYQSLTARLESLSAAQEEEIRRHVVAQREAEAVVADIKAILMDHSIHHLAIRMNDAMKRIDAYENRSSATEGGES